MPCVLNDSVFWKIILIVEEGRFSFKPPSDMRRLFLTTRRGTPEKPKFYFLIKSPLPTLVHSFVAAIEFNFFVIPVVVSEQQRLTFCLFSINMIK